MAPCRRLDEDFSRVIGDRARTLRLERRLYVVYMGLHGGCKIRTIRSDELFTLIGFFAAIVSICTQIASLSLPQC
jgi:hypothetical protein